MRIMDNILHLLKLFLQEFVFILQSFINLLRRLIEVIEDRTGAPGKMEPEPWKIDKYKNLIDAKLDEYRQSCYEYNIYGKYGPRYLEKPKRYEVDKNYINDNPSLPEQILTASKYDASPEDLPTLNKALAIIISERIENVSQELSEVDFSELIGPVHDLEEARTGIKVLEKISLLASKEDKRKIYEEIEYLNERIKKIERRILSGVNVH